MAPFMGIPSAKERVEQDLNWLYENNVAYEKNFHDGSTAKLLWRYSAAQPSWRSTWMTSVDYSTMVMGYAMKYLPENFYPIYNTGFINDGKLQSCFADLYAYIFTRFINSNSILNAL